MKIKECAYFAHETLIGTPAENCNLFPYVYDPVGNFRFIECVAIPISKCPYKQYMSGMIDKEDLNKKIMKILTKR